MKILRRHDVFTEWAGPSPYFLVINTPDPHIIDIDEPGWLSEEPALMRAEGEWLLVRKGPTDLRESVPLMALRVTPGDQPYFVKKHVGTPMNGMEVVAYGIGKKRTDGHVDRLWLLPNGIVCGGDDADIILSNILRNLASG